MNYTPKTPWIQGITVCPQNCIGCNIDCDGDAVQPTETGEELPCDHDCANCIFIQCPKD